MPAASKDAASISGVIPISFKASLVTGPMAQTFVFSGIANSFKYAFTPDALPKPDGCMLKEVYHLQEVSLLHDTTPGLYKK